MLNKIQKLLETEGFTTNFEKASEEVPVDRLLVLVELDDKPAEDGLINELMFVPGIEEEIEDFKILQNVVFYPYDLRDYEDQQLMTLNEYLHYLNADLPLGHYGFKLDDGLLYYKYMFYLPKTQNDITDKTIIEVQWMMQYIVNLHSENFRLILEEKVSIDSLLNSDDN